MVASAILSLKLFTPSVDPVLLCLVYPPTAIGSILPYEIEVCSRCYVLNWV